MNYTQKHRAWKIAEAHAERLGISGAELHDCIRGLMKMKTIDDKMSAIEYTLARLNKEVTQ
jgi:hypothetical protein